MRSDSTDLANCGQRMPRFFTPSVSRAGGVGKRKNRKIHRLSTAELLASSELHGFSRCESAGAPVARRSCRSTPASRNQPDSAATLSARNLARCARHHARLRKLEVHGCGRELVPPAGHTTGLSSRRLVPVCKFLPIFCRTGSAHFTEDARKVLLVLEPASHRHIQHAHLCVTQHLLGTLYPAVQHKLVRALAR